MNKQNNIRKKALDYAKKRQWDKALEEFSRLVEIEQHNPNLFNEIGDIHLKLGNKREAFKRYHEAIDAYARVGLLNNALAVCKKILRLNPNDDLVCGRMATLRQRQGFAREATTYSLEFLDKILRSPESGHDYRTLVAEIADMSGELPEILERAAEYLLRLDAGAECGAVLAKLERLYQSRGMTAELQAVQRKMTSIGYAAPIEPETADSEPQIFEPADSRRKPGSGPIEREVPFSGCTPPHIRRGHSGDVAADFGVVDMGNDRAGERTQPAAVPEPPGPTERTNPSHARAREEFEPDSSALDKARRSPARSASAPASPSVSAVEDAPSEPKEYAIPGEVPGADDASDGKDEEIDPTGVFTDAAREVKADVDEGDHRSHYDLGMAYLEMNLLTEAIREFQFAAGSPTYQLRSLEMIGRCFITQNQPKLAIKQLSKGLSLMGGDDRAALGIKYSLGLAYEMVGEIEKAKALFEDVYVVDVTFREVEQKIKKYQS